MNAVVCDCCKKVITNNYFNVEVRNVASIICVSRGKGHDLCSLSCISDYFKPKG